MARPSAMTPGKIAKLREARKAGQGLRAAAKAIGVSAATASAWEKRDRELTGAEARPKQGGRTTPEAAAAADKIVSAPLPARDNPEALAIVRARSELLTDLLEDLRPGVEKGEYPATSWVTLAKYGDDLARTIAEMTPPAPKDPNSDPDVIEAERILLSRLERLVADAEKKR